MTKWDKRLKKDHVAGDHTAHHSVPMDGKVRWGSREPMKEWGRLNKDEQMQKEGHETQLGANQKGRNKNARLGVARGQKMSNMLKAPVQALTPQKYQPHTNRGKTEESQLQSR